MLKYIFPILLFTVNIYAQSPSTPGGGAILKNISFSYQSQQDKEHEKLSQMANLAFENINQISQKLKSIDLKADDLQTEFQKVNKLWKEIISLNQNNPDFLTQEPTSNYLKTIKKNLEISRNEELSKFLIKTKKTLETNDEKFKIDYKKRKENYLIEVHKTFGLVSEKRSLMFQSLINSSNLNFTTIDHTEDIKLEASTLPLKGISYLEDKLVDLKKIIFGGFGAWLRFLKRTMLFLLIIFLAVNAIRFTRNIETVLDSKRRELVRKGYRDPQARVLASWLEKITPYTHWLLILTALTLGKKYIFNNNWPEITFLSSFVEYYVYYKIFRIFIRQLLSSRRLMSGRLQVLRNKPKIIKTSRALGFYVLWWLVINNLIKSTIGYGYIYFWVSSIFNVIFILLLFFIFSFWRMEFKELSLKVFGKRNNALVQSLLSNKSAVFFSFPIGVLLILIVTFENILKWGERFDFVKSIYAEIYRKKIENSSTKTQGQVLGIPHKYIETFKGINFEKTVSLNQTKVINDISKKINQWEEGKSEDNMIALVGSKGSGKTLCVESIKKQISIKNCEILTLTKKVTHEKDLEFVFEATNFESPIVIILDDFHHSFLSQVGGFKAFKSFLRKTQEIETPVFWCLTFNDHSWDFLQSVLNNTRYFSQIFHIKKFTEDEIKDLILGQHNSTDYSIVYDEALHVSQAVAEEDSLSNVENKYFRLLWEESLGNPTVANELWLNCLKPYWGQKIKIGVPKDRSEPISGLPDDFYFVLASIVRHESLSRRQVVSTTCLDEDIVVNALKSCLELGYLTKQGIKYQVSTPWQYTVYSTLRRKNFIYG